MLTVTVHVEIVRSLFYARKCGREFLIDKACEEYGLYNKIKKKQTCSRHNLNSGSHFMEIK